MNFTIIYQQNFTNFRPYDHINLLNLIEKKKEKMIEKYEKKVFIVKYHSISFSLRHILCLRTYALSLCLRKFIKFKLPPLFLASTCIIFLPLFFYWNIRRHMKQYIRTIFFFIWVWEDRRNSYNDAVYGISFFFFFLLLSFLSVHSSCIWYFFP